MPRSISNKLTNYLLLPLLSVGLFVIVVETGLWLFGINPYPRGVEFTVNRALDYPDVFLKDRDLFWRLRPQRTIVSEFFEGKSYRINRQGFRGEDFHIEKNGLRIAILGNSCSFGWGVSEEESFGGQLQTMLRRIPGMEAAEVYNFSVPGYSSFQGKRNYPLHVRPYKPDILLVTFAWNDQWVAASGRADNQQQMPPRLILDIYNRLGPTRLYRFYKGWLFSVTGGREMLEYRDQEARVSLEDFKANLTEIIKMARQDGARVILLTSPIPSMETYYRISGQTYMHERHYHYNDITREAAALNSVELVDLAAIFDRFDNLFDNVLRDPFHYNSAGHALAAKEIFRALGEYR